MSSVFEFDAPEAGELQSSGGFINAPGKYHCMIGNVEINPVMGDKMTKGFAFELTAQAGPASEIGKSIRVIFGNPDASHKDGGKFARAKQIAAMIAANVMTPEDLGKKGLKIELDAMDAHQVCVHLEMGKVNAKGKQYCELAYADIFHVDDPRAESYPKDKSLIDSIPAEFRRKPEFFAPLTAKPKPATTQRVTDSDFDGL